MPHKPPVRPDRPRAKSLTYGVLSIAQGLLLGVGILALSSPLFSPNVPVRVGTSSPHWTLFATLSPQIFLAVAAACLLGALVLAILRRWLRRRWAGEIGVPSG